MAKKRYALVGASFRGRGMYAVPIKEEYSDVAELVAVFDINYGRACVVAEAAGGAPVYTDFDKMLEETKPDCIIVATVDCYHAEYIIRGIKAGVQVFTEKPMCINAEQCRAILEAEREYNNKIGVCFNVRYSATLSRLKELIPMVGDVYAVNFDWLLPRNKLTGAHGASYYRRWNAYMEKSGGLLITKATHHFDMINWLLGQKPEKVSAFGKLRVYGKNGTKHATRCLECSHKDSCEFYTPIDEDMQKLYVDNEKYDGYMVDRCVFDEKIDIYDSMAIIVEYSGGTIMSYTESSAAPYEGHKLYITGSKGRIEVNYYSEGGLRKNEMVDYVRFIDNEGNVVTYSEPIAKTGGHDGADPALRKVLYGGQDPVIPTQRAGALDGAYSILVGAAANEAIKERKTVVIDEFIGDPTLLKR